MLKFSHKWQPIQGLQPDWASLSDGELDSLIGVWNDLKESAEAEGARERFLQQLRRRWAIETGVIAGAYSLDSVITDTLIERGIEAAWISREESGKDPLRVAAIIQAHAQALEGLLSLANSERNLSPAYIQELHQALLRHVDTVTTVDPEGNWVETPLEKGAYKKWSNNPRRPDGFIHEYCPPEEVAKQMEALVEMHAQHEASNVPTEISAAWLHHRFNQIHPFQGGNGRVALALAAFAFVKSGWFPPVINRDDRTAYFDALETADAGNLQPLVELFVRRERLTLIDLLAAREAVQQPASVEDAIRLAVQAYRDHVATSNAGLDRAQRLAMRLSARARTQLETAIVSLHKEIQRIDPKFRYSLHAGAPDGFREAAAKAVTYTVNLEDHSDAECSLFGRDIENGICIWFHGIGSEYHGALGAAAFFVQSGTPHLISAPFLFSHRESDDKLAARFDGWLEKSLTQGIWKWRSSL